MEEHTARIVRRILAVLCWLHTLPLIVFAAYAIVLGTLPASITLSLLAVPAFFAQWGLVPVFSPLFAMVFGVAAFAFGALGWGLWQAREWARRTCVAVACATLILFAVEVGYGPGHLWLLDALWVTVGFELDAGSLVKLGWVAALFGQFVFLQFISAVRNQFPRT